MKQMAFGMSRTQAVRRFFRTPKGLLTLVLLLLVAVAAPREGLQIVWPGLLSAVLVAGLLDVVILRLRHPRWEFPSGAVLTGLIVAMVLSPFEPWWVPAATSAIAIASKYILRTRATNVFNPAALALIVSFYAFNTGQSWWGALPELPMWAIGGLFATGVFITDRVNKMPLVLAFLGVYFGLFSLMAFIGDPRHVVEIFRAPDLHAVLYFAFFMLTDPPTAPIKYKDQIVCGVLVAVVSYTLFETAGVVYYLLAGLMVGNVWEAWRRLRFRKVHSRRLAIS
jgi:enediyne biosynthesis protein E5